VDDQTLTRLELLGVVLLVASAAVLVLTVGSALVVASSETELPGVDELQRESRGPLALLLLAGGVTGAGVLAGLGGILRLLVAQARDRDEGERSTGTGHRD